MDADDRPDLCGDDLQTIFQSLFDKHARDVRRYLASRAGPTVADDLVSDTFLIALQRRASYDPARASARAWLFGIATNLLRQHARAENRYLRMTADDHRTRVTQGHADRVADRVDAQVRVRELAAALADLSPGHRDVLLLASWGELDASEIAAVLDIPAGTVRSRLHRARQLLRAQATPKALGSLEGERTDD
ncbi:RNA polymerase sigma factor [Amycolatopsis sp. H20-H5]|uniref:RNA polymerase sigma factor n=1 Tax=Amycolatopsis sp. H20-H5 TaxID=3046309 RepID=UPI002DBBA0C5|nr:RNA polymerase sigma factor [Amycolatopsis sp. H20-H5]MEC3975874.1 RNA polymerase sigma factor [Amycolatopsis sp. H20-H5]